MTNETPALTLQIGGSHYKGLLIQPVEYIMKNGIPFMEGNVIKYVSRWRDKGGVEDLKKARHYLDMLIEFESQTPEQKALSFERAAEAWKKLEEESA
jgi:hypothetical protein